MELRLKRSDKCDVHLYILRVGGDRVIKDPDTIPKDAYALVTIEPVNTVEDFWEQYRRHAD